jgi:ribonuclease HI
MSTIEGEAMALLEAKKAMEHRGMACVIFEMDWKSVANAINNIHVGNS